MTLTDTDRRRIVAELDRAEAAVREAALATLSAFVTWLIAELKDVYRRIKDDVDRVWAILRAMV